jgi:hypothetical protein
MRQRLDSDDVYPLKQRLIAWDLLDATASESHNENSAAPSRATQRVVKDVASDRIEDHIRASPTGQFHDAGTKVIHPMVDQVVSASSLRRR